MRPRSRPSVFSSLCSTFATPDIASELRGRAADVLIDVAIEMGATWPELSAHTSQHGRPRQAMCIQSSTDFWSLIKNAESRFAGSDLALQWGRRVGLQAMGTMGMAVMSEETIQEATSYILSVHRLLEAPFKLESHIVGEEVWFSTVYPPGLRLKPAASFHADCLAAMCVTALTTLLGRPAKAANYLTPRRSCSNHQRYLDLVADHVEDAPNMHYTVAYPISLLKEQILTRNRTLAQEQGQIFRMALDATTPQPPLGQAIRDLLRDCIAAPPSLDVAASKLGIAPRTLRKELDLNGQTYRSLLKELRLECAAELLRSGKSVRYVCDTLGYSDVANFRRAFKKWTASPPSTWRAEEGRL